MAQKKEMTKPYIAILFLISLILIGISMSYRDFLLFVASIMMAVLAFVSFTKSVYKKEVK